MQIRITGRHLEITPAIRDYAEKKISSLKKYFDHILEAHVIVKVEKNRQACEIKMPVNGLFIYADESGEDLYVSIDKAVSKIERQLKKFKDKIKSKNQREIKEFKSDMIMPEVISGSFDDDEPVLVKVDRFARKPMSTRDAVVQLDLEHSDFIVFTNSDDNQVNVIYRRFDGSYGVIAKN